VSVKGGHAVSQKLTSKERFMSKKAVGNSGVERWWQRFARDVR